MCISNFYVVVRIFFLNIIGYELELGLGFEGSFFFLRWGNVVVVVGCILEF